MDGDPTGARADGAALLSEYFDKNGVTVGYHQHSSDTTFLIPHGSKDPRGGIPFDTLLDRVYCIDSAVYIEHTEEREHILLGIYNTEEDAEAVAHAISMLRGNMALGVCLPDPDDRSGMESLREYCGR